MDTPNEGNNSSKVHNHQEIKMAEQKDDWGAEYKEVVFDPPYDGTKSVCSNTMTSIDIGENEAYCVSRWGKYVGTMKKPGWWAHPHPCCGGYDFWKMSL